MKAYSGKNSGQEPKISLKESLKNTFYTKLRSEKSKQFMLNHLIPISFFLLISVFIFRNIIGVKGEIINADLIRPPELDRFLQLFIPMWREYESVTTLSRLPALLFYLPFIGIGYLFNLSTTEVIILVSIFAETLTGVSMYYASKYVLKKTYKVNNHKITLAAFLAGLTYMWHGYMIYHALHPLIRVAYAFAPFIILALIVGLEKKNYKYLILAAFLWSVACADLHWVVYGAILILSFLIFNFILECIKSTKSNRLKTIKKSTVFHLKSFLILIGLFFGFSSYWVIPGVFMGGTSRYGYVLTLEDLEKYNAQATMTHMMRKQGEHPLTREMFATNSEILGSPIMLNFIILISFGVIIFALMALILKPKNRYVIFFSCFALLTLFLATCINFIPEFGLWFINEAPLHELYGWAFRSPKIAQFIILSLCFLLAFSIVEILTRIEKSKFKAINWKRGATIFIISILLLSILLPNWPLATGDLNNRMMPTSIPKEFEEVNSWLEDQEGDFKVLWLPPYNNRYVDWNMGHRTILDIASLTSSQPAFFYNINVQPNRYGIYFLVSTTGAHSHSLLANNASGSFGKLLAPLGVKYVIFHDDNSTFEGDPNVILNNLKHQKDLNLVKKFGFIYAFENKYYDKQQNTHFFTTSKNLLVFGGLASLAALNSIPQYDSREDCLIFANQKRYDINELNEIVDDIIFTEYNGLEEVIFTFADDKYFIVPYDSSEHYAPHAMWSKARLASNPWFRMRKRANIEGCDWSYDGGVVFTFSPGTLNEDAHVTTQDLMKYINFENGLNDFKSQTSLLEISLGNNSFTGSYSLMGVIPKGDSPLVQIASSKLIPIINVSNYYRSIIYLSIENTNNVQVIVKYFNIDKEFIAQKYILTESGNFKFRRFEDDLNFPPDTRYYSIQIVTNQNPNAESIWWIDDIQIYDLKSSIIQNKFKMDFNVETDEDYELYIRTLKCEMGGKIGIYLDNKFLDSLDTIDNTNAFNWEKVGSIQLQKGQHTIAIDNVAGFNAVNLIAVIPKQKMYDYIEIAEDLLEDKGLIYIFEAESNFQSNNATISDEYGNSASSGKVLTFINNSQALLPVKIFKTGEYSLSLRAVEGNKYETIQVTNRNNSYELEHKGGNGFKWLNITNISLTKGIQELKISTFEEEPRLLSFSFERGWNSSLKAPQTWSPPQPQYFASLDPTEKTDGGCSLKLTTRTTVPNTWSWMRSQEITLEPSRFYEAKIDLKIKNVNNSNVKIYGFNVTLGDWEQISTIRSGLKGTNDWREYSKSFFVSEDMSKIIVILNLGTVLNSSAGRAFIWFDNFELLEVVEDKNYKIDFAVLYLNRNNQTLEDLFTGAQAVTILNYEKIDATKYEVKITSTAPFMLGFAEVYDEFWVASVEGLGTVKSTPLYGMLNGFYINKIGTFTIIIAYEPQQWFKIGMGITGFCIIVSFGYFIWIERKRWGDKLKKIFGKEEKSMRINGGRQK